jgi:hypothetical protein
MPIVAPRAKLGHSGNTAPVSLLLLSLLESTDDVDESPEPLLVPSLVVVAAVVPVVDSPDSLVGAAPPQAARAITTTFAEPRTSSSVAHCR